MKRPLLILLWLVVGGIIAANADSSTVMPLEVKVFKAGRVVAEQTVDSIVVWEKSDPPVPPQVIPGKNLLMLAGKEAYLNGVRQEISAPGIEDCRFIKATTDEEGNVYILGNVHWLYTDDDSETHLMVSNLIWKNFEFDAEYVFEYTGRIHVNSFAVTGDNRYIVFELGEYYGNEFRIELSPVITCNDQILTVGTDHTIAFSNWKAVDGELRGAASVLFDTDEATTDSHFAQAMVCSEVKADGTITRLTPPDLSRADIIVDFAVHDGRFMPVGSVNWSDPESDPYFAAIFNTGDGWWNYEFNSTTYSSVHGLGYLSDGRRVILVRNGDLDRMQVLVDGWTPLYTLDPPPLDGDSAAEAPVRRAAGLFRAENGYKMIVDGNDVYATSIIPSDSGGMSMAGVWKNGALLYHVKEIIIDDILLY